jgi:hypothetical protein
MAVNHNINVNLRQARGTQTRTSAVRGVQKVTTARETSPSSARQLARGLRTVRTLDSGSLGLFGGMGGATMTVVQESVKLANRAVDIYLDINLARTGEVLRVGNIKRVKGYLLNPTKFAVDATYGVWLQRLRTNRANQENDYYRELSGNLITSNQFGNKR